MSAGNASPFKDLPLEALYDLLVNAVQDLLKAMETGPAETSMLQEKKNLAELIHAAILEKQSPGSIQ